MEESEAVLVKGLSEMSVKTSDDMPTLTKEASAMSMGSDADFSSMPSLAQQFSTMSVEEEVEERTLIGWNPSHCGHASSSTHVENPQRILSPLSALKRAFETHRRVRFLSQFPTVSRADLELVHEPEYLDRILSTEKKTQEELNQEAALYDSIYLAPGSGAAAEQAVSTSIGLLRWICEKEGRNAFGLVRPSGHHAFPGSANGFCLLNNAAIAVSLALRDGLAKKVFLLDWDVHHGQATQDIFYEDDRVLYLSVHRFEEGRFWPHLRRSHSDAVGNGNGRGYNVNLPLQETGCGDADYAFLLYSVILPMAIEMEPDLVVVNAGFDAAAGDPKGGMAVSPAWFAHATALLLPIARGRMLALLEGGYNVEMLAECTVAMVRVLAGDIPPPLPPLSPPKLSTVRTALDTIEYVRESSRGRLLLDTRTLAARFKIRPKKRKLCFKDVSSGSPEDTTSVSNAASNVPFGVKTDAAHSIPQIHVTGLAWEEELNPLHVDWEPGHPECPERTASILHALACSGLKSRTRPFPVRPVTSTELYMFHTEEYVEELRSLCACEPERLDVWSGEEGEKKSVYLTPHSFQVAANAAGTIIDMAVAIAEGRLSNGFANLRPPGHHAEAGEAFGFCLFANVVLAAKEIQRRNLASRILILDWDVHHGNGTQNAFWDSREVLFISLHRHTQGFFPCSDEANFHRIGGPNALGYNVNIPWNVNKAGNAEYMAAFTQVVLPIIASFAPEFIFVSSGFDAAEGDPLGGFSLTPASFGFITRSLRAFANGKLLLVLEGGYNLKSISECAVSCVSGLLSDPLSTSGLLGGDRLLKSPPVLTHLLATQSAVWPALALWIRALRHQASPDPIDQSEELHTSVPKEAHE